MLKRKGCLISLILIVICFGSLFYYVFGQEYRYAKNYANQLFSYPLPVKTEAISKYFDYGVLYGGGPHGSGGHPTVAAYMRLSTELSEKEIFDYYNKDGFEIYFEGEETIKKNDEGKVWYEGEKATGKDLSEKSNTGDPIRVIIQYRREYSYPFFIDFY